MIDYAPLLRPLEIKGVRIRNRIMSTAHTSGASEDGKPLERYQRYHEEKAKGGIGLTIIGGSSAVAEDTPGAAMLHLDASTDDIVPSYRQLAERVHRHGATVFAQIAHMGRRANWDNQHWLPPIAPSRVREPAHRSFPKAMEDWDFRRIRDAFGAAAGRVKQGGLDGLELSASHGHLIDQFWSPRTNRRTDGYGGTLEARMRFTLEILATIRAAVGADFVVGVRLSGDEFLDEGIGPDEAAAIARILVQEGGVDYLSVLAGQAESLPAHAVIFPGMDTPSAPFLSIAAAIKAVVPVPVFHAQRVTDVATAARAVASGAADMVAMTRAHLADPHIVRKLVEGRVDDIRPCIGASYCIDRLYSGGQAFCLHNPASGRERDLPHEIARARRSMRAVVVGAGPGGLEAARVLAHRGHRVTLFEKESQTGGALRLAARVSWRESLLAVTRWLEQQVRKCGVDVRLCAAATPDDIAALRPEIVVLATGCGPARPDLAGAERALTVHEALMEPVEPGTSILLFDDNGAESALGCAEYLAERGARVEFVTADPHPGGLLERTTRPIFLRRLYARDVVFTPDHRLVAVESEGNRLVGVLRNEYTDAEEERLVDRVVVDYGGLPDESLYDALKPRSINLGEWDYAALIGGRPQSVRRNEAGEFQLFRIGDAISSRNVHAAILDALRLCKDL